jgi:peptide-methionine (S)-S-oxide reductase
MEKATFAAGCFWKVEDSFRYLKGVLSTAVGYTGGHWPHPCYLDVCARVTGHAEAVQLEYDPRQVSYEELLDVFWNCHDPRQFNRQGPDRGEQYRSVIFCHTQDQEEAARNSKEKLRQSGKYEQEIVTQIQPASEFYLAEEEHQQYLEKKRRKLKQIEA